MSQISRTSFGKAALGATAISLMLGAAQFASGHDLVGSIQPISGASKDGINRTAKADRAGPVVMRPAPTRTVSLRPDGIADMLILVRIPLAREVRDLAPATSPIQPANRRFTVACEPVVSILTEVAKVLQPGRCVT